MLINSPCSIDSTIRMQWRLRRRRTKREPIPRFSLFLSLYLPTLSRSKRVENARYLAECRCFPVFYPPHFRLLANRTSEIPRSFPLCWLTANDCIIDRPPLFDRRPKRYSRRPKLLLLCSQLKISIQPIIHRNARVAYITVDLSQSPIAINIEAIIIAFRTTNRKWNLIRNFWMLKFPLLVIISNNIYTDLDTWRV